MSVDTLITMSWNASVRLQQGTEQAAGMITMHLTMFLLSLKFEHSLQINLARLMTRSKRAFYPTTVQTSGGGNEHTLWFWGCLHAHVLGSILMRRLQHVEVN